MQFQQYFIFYIVEYPCDLPIWHLRLIPALCGSLLVPIVYLIMTEIGYTDWTAVQAAVLVLFGKYCLYIEIVSNRHNEVQTASLVLIVLRNKLFHLCWLFLEINYCFYQTCPVPCSVPLVKALDTLVNCQRPVYSLGVS